jgi:hypothetical protein
MLILLLILIAARSAPGLAVLHGLGLIPRGLVEGETNGYPRTLRPVMLVASIPATLALVAATAYGVPWLAWRPSHRGRPSE